jgi:uncharacterized repeat protein (TIGR03803 family)
MTKRNGWKMACTMFALCAATAITAQAQKFQTLASFDGTDGAYPDRMSLVQGTNRDFYGTTEYGGANCSADNGCGTVFKLTAGGTLTTLYSFCAQVGCTDGAYPIAGLVQATNGNFYGTTWGGGANGNGTVFEITPSGALTTLYSFCAQTGCIDGSNPGAALIQATDQNFYGTTYNGGANCSGIGGSGCGTVFKMTSTGNLTTIYNFAGTDGANPFAGLIQATNGKFYGITPRGGANFGGGTIFTITPHGQLTTLYSFCAQIYCNDGNGPYGGLVQARNGNFYGTAYGGGANNGGTVFTITPQGRLTVLYNFCAQTNCPGGYSPAAGLIQATDGNFYGTTSVGTVVEITPGGTLTTLHRFDGAEGYLIYGGLLQATNGKFYGTTSGGGITNDCGSFGCGTAFSLSTGLGPFVKTLPTAGKVGTEVRILGTDLTGATGVTFNGTAAQFSVRLPSLILTHVPTGATTGTIKVTLPGGTLSSNVPFYVLP